MPKRVQLPDGSIGEFPDSMGDDQIEAVLKKQFPAKGPAPMAAVRSIPRWSDPGGIAYHLRDIRNRVINELPAAGGFLGGIIGAGGGAETGPGAIATAAVGAGAGGALGEDARQEIMEKLYPHAPKMGALEAGARIAGQGALQAGNEVVGQAGGRLAGRVLRPVADSFPVLQKYPILRHLFAVGNSTSPKAAEHLTAAAAGKQRAGEALEAIGNTLGDIESEMQKLPTGERNVEGFLRSVNSRKDAMNAEAGVAMMTPVEIPESYAESIASPRVSGGSPSPQEAYQNWFNGVLRRHAQEAAGQAVLDDMVERGIKPSDVSKHFWEKTYFNLPEEGQRRFQKYLTGLWGGAKPGDVIGTSADGSPLIAKDWADLAEKLDIGSSAEHLEGTERGYVALMKEANERFTSQVHPPAPRVAPVPRQLSGSAAPRAAKKVPLRAAKTVPTGIADSIRSLIRDYMPNTQVGKSQRAYLMKRAAEFEKPWSYGELDQLRTDLSSQLSKHSARGSVAKYTAEKGDLDLAIDNAILDGLRDTIYPEMDRVSGRPAGYWENLKRRQASLIRLQEILDRRVKDLKGAQAVSEVTPRFSHENISVSGHPGSMPRMGFYGMRNALAPKREMKEASKHVAKAFPTVNSLPYQVLFSAGIRASEIKGPAPRRKQQDQNATDAYAGTGVPME